MNDKVIIFQPAPTGHWKELFAQKNLVFGSHNLNPGEEIVAVIDHIEKGIIKREKGVEEEINMIHFDPKCQMVPMGLNVGNSKIIAALHGDKYAGWSGKAIQIYVGEVKQYGGGMGPGLCVRPTKPDIGEPVDNYIDQMHKCKTKEQLVSVYKKIPKHLKAQGSSTGKKLEACKDQMKHEVGA